MTPDRDGRARALAAGRARRYRRRQAGETVPHRKPGPEPAGQETDRLRRQNRELRGELAEARRQAAAPVGRRMIRSYTAEGVRTLLGYLTTSPARLDTPDMRVLLLDLAAEIDNRRDDWPD